MTRVIPSLLCDDLAEPAKTLTYLLKVKPLATAMSTASIFGITSGNVDFTYDDGTVDGEITYRCATGYTPFDVETKSDMSVNNSEAAALLAQYPIDGMTIEAVNRGDYDGARFVQYLVNYKNGSHGHTIIDSGQIGMVTQVDELACRIELRSLQQILKQLSMVELTSITCRAQYGDARCKQPLRWYNGTVASVGAEADRTFVLTLAPGSGVVPGSGTFPVTAVPFFTGDGTTRIFQLLDTAGEAVTSGFTVTDIKLNGTITSACTISGAGLVTFTTAPGAGVAGTWDGTLTENPDGFFVPGMVEWLTGPNAGMQLETETYVSSTGTVTLAIPTFYNIAAGHILKLRRDCDKSKAMCKAYGNLPNMRAEPELPRGNGVSLQSPDQTLQAATQ
jgi:uncharacterized phage protein (TIGR02218 family)